MLKHAGVHSLYVIYSLLLKTITGSIHHFCPSLSLHSIARFLYYLHIHTYTHIYIHIFLKFIFMCVCVCVSVLQVLYTPFVVFCIFLFCLHLFPCVLGGQKMGNLVCLLHIHISKYTSTNYFSFSVLH